MIPPENEPFLGPVQRRVIAAALTFLAGVAIIALLVFCVDQLGHLLVVFSALIWPLAVAGILAMILQPVVDGLERLLRVSRVIAVGLLFSVFLSICAFAAITVVPPLVGQTTTIVKRLPAFWESSVDAVAKQLSRIFPASEVAQEGRQLHIELKTVLQELERSSPAWLTSASSFGGRLVSVISFFAGLAMIPIYLFYFLLARGDPLESLDGYLPFFKDETRADAVFLVREFVRLVVTFFRGQLLIGFLLGVAYAIGFSLVGLEFAMVIGLTMGLLNVVPYLGTSLGLLLALPTGLFQAEGGWVLVGMVLGVVLFVQLLEGWVLTPAIMGQQTGLHPVVIMISIVFWGIALRGILGVALAIPLTAFFVTVWRLAKQKYLRPIA